MTGTTYTIAYWIKPEAGETYGSVLTQGGTAGVYYHASTARHNYLYSAGTERENTAQLTAGTWYHVAIVVASNTVTFYLHGVADGGGAGAGSFTPSTSGNNASSETFKGALDDLRIYSRALSAEDVAALYTWDEGTAPTITSNGGGSTASISIGENRKWVTTVVATGDAPITFTKSGMDHAKFSVGSTTGILKFLTRPDYENPTDANTNNVYEVTVTATNDAGSDAQDISVTVTNVITEGASPAVAGRHGLSLAVGLGM